MAFKHHLLAATLAAVPLAHAAPALAAAPPPNDGFGHRIVVSALPFRHSEDTSGATAAADDPTTCFPASASVWFSYRPPTHQRVAADTIGSDYDTSLSVFTGTRGSLTPVACDDDSVGLQSAVEFKAVAGTTYYFMVAACCGDTTAGGRLVFHVRKNVLPPAAQVTVSGGSVDTTSGLATIRGTVTCRNAFHTTGFVDVVLRQVHQGFLARGENFVEATCDRAVHDWTVVIESQTDRAFLPGAASATATGQSCDPLTCATDTTAVTVRLRSG